MNCCFERHRTALRCRDLRMLKQRAGGTKVVRRARGRVRCFAVLVERALTWQQSEVEADEVECVVANLIARKYVKGYISHKAQVVPLRLPLAPVPCKHLVHRLMLARC